MTKEVATKKENAVGEVLDYGDEAGRGFETMSSKDLSIPFITVLQANSPIVVNQEVPGAKMGGLFNTVNKNIIDGEKGFIFQPCWKDHAYVEWRKRENAGGGFIAVHQPTSQFVLDAIKFNGGNSFGRLKLPNEQHELIETHYVYGLILNEEGTEVEDFAVLSFTSTKIKPCKDWFTVMYKLKGQPPLYANRARIKTFKDSNDKGTYANYRIEPLAADWKQSLIPPKDENGNKNPLLIKGKEFQELVTSGAAKAAFETEKAAESDEDDGVMDTSATTVEGDGKKVPF